MHLEREGKGREGGCWNRGKSRGTERGRCAQVTTPGANHPLFSPGSGNGHGQAEGFSAGNLWGDAKALRVGKCGNCAGEGLDAAPGAAPSAREVSPSAQGRCSPSGAGLPLPSPPLGAVEIWGVGPVGCLGDPQGREEAAQAEPRVSRPRDALPKTFPAWNFTPLSHGNSEDKPGGSPPVSAGAAGGSWQLLVALGSSWWLLAAPQHGHAATERWRHLRARAARGGGSAAAASFALGVGRSSGEFHKAGQRLLRGPGGGKREILVARGSCLLPEPTEPTLEPSAPAAPSPLLTVGSPEVFSPLSAAASPLLSIPTWRQLLGDRLLLL